MKTIGAGTKNPGTQNGEQPKKETGKKGKK